MSPDISVIVLQHKFSHQRKCYELLKEGETTVQISYMTSTPHRSTNNLFSAAAFFTLHTSFSSASSLSNCFSSLPLLSNNRSCSANHFPQSAPRTSFLPSLIFSSATQSCLDPLYYRSGQVSLHAPPLLSPMYY